MSVKKKKEKRKEKKKKKQFFLTEQTKNSMGFLWYSFRNCALLNSFLNVQITE